MAFYVAKWEGANGAVSWDIRLDGEPHWVPMSFTDLAEAESRCAWMNVAFAEGQLAHARRLSSAVDAAASALVTCGATLREALEAFVRVMEKTDGR